MGEPYQYCEVSDIVATEPQCQRLAQWVIADLGGPGEDVMLCNFHAEPFTVDLRPQP